MVLLPKAFYRELILYLIWSIADIRFNVYLYKTVDRCYVSCSGFKVLFITVALHSVVPQGTSFCPSFFLYNFVSPEVNNYSIELETFFQCLKCSSSSKIDIKIEGNDRYTTLSVDLYHSFKLSKRILKIHDKKMQIKHLLTHLSAFCFIW